MDFRKSRLARHLTTFFALAAAALFLTGCDVKIINRTPATFSENPSQVYTFTAEVKPRGGVVNRDSIQPSIVIDGQVFPMKPSPAGGDLWEFDYHLPPGRTEGAYYFIATYQTTSDGRTNNREAYTELYRFSVVNRYGLSLDASRAPVGAQVTVLGRGFTPQDVVYVGDQPAQTIFRSSNSLSFVVPPLPAGRNYPVTVGEPGSGISVGTIRVDQGALTVAPSSLNLATGERRLLVFTIPTEAPAGGLVLDVTTDIPASVIMPEVVVPEGARSVNVAVQGGEPGSGSLFVTAPGFGEITVPVTVVAR
ncbi:MAG: cell surface protein [Verrucomicrobia bacterium]|nr:MAG: cell surface protein [Verrucomicrobiota bacterium]